MVRLKVKETNFGCYAVSNFNSTMVRLKEQVSPVSRPYSLNFNSTMVRLKAHRQRGNLRDKTISIPLWYD